MKLARLPIILVMILLVGSQPVVADVILNCDFEGLEAGQAIGVGGPTLGEPTMIYGALVPLVTDTPMTTQCLKIEDNSDGSTGFIKFGFLADSVVSSGIMEFSIDLWFEEMEDTYDISLECPLSGYTKIQFLTSGELLISDYNGYVDFFGDFTTGRLYNLKIINDLDAGTYDVLFDDELLLENRPHGNPHGGIDRVILTLQSDSDLDGVFYADNLVVLAEDIVAVTSLSFGSIKSLYR